MNNKEEYFYNLRNKLVGESCKELKQAKERYKTIIANNPNNKYLYYNPNIRDRILDDLSYNGYNINDKGVQYLASLIMLYIHERKLFRLDEENNYWDLDLENNKHYSMLGENPDKLRKAIEKSIQNNEEEYSKLSQIVYETADHYGYFGLDRIDPKRKSYTLTLVYNKKSTK